LAVPVLRNERSPRFIAPWLLLRHRPPEAHARGRVGEWEGDLIVGRMNRSAIGTLVDPCSRLVKLIHLPHGHRADQLLEAGLTARAAADQLGHAKVSMTTDHYYGRRKRSTGAARVLEALNDRGALNEKGG
jgi:IS30 family transposase